MWEAAAGSAFGGLPTEDVSGTIETTKEAIEICSQSRLWGGMHFTAAVPAGEALVEGFGQATWDYTQMLMGGDNPSGVERECGINAKMTFMSSNYVGEKLKVKNTFEGVADACKCEDLCAESTIFYVITHKKQKTYDFCQCLEASLEDLVDIADSEDFVSGPVDLLLKH